MLFNNTIRVDITHAKQEQACEEKNVVVAENTNINRLVSRLAQACNTNVGKRGGTVFERKDDNNESHS